MTMRQFEAPAEVADVSPMRNLAALSTIVWRHKWLVALGIVIGLVLAALAYLQASPVFQSTAQVLVVQKRADAVVQNPAEPQNSYYEDFLATHIILIQSEEILDRAAKLVKIEELSNPPPHKNVIALLRSGLSIAREKDTTSGPTNVMSISFRASSPSDSVLLLKAIINAYRDFLNEKFGTMNDETLKLIQKAQSVLEKDLNVKQEALEKIRLQNPLIIKSKDGVLTFLERINQIEGRKAKLELRQKEIETRQAVITDALKNGVRRSAILAMLKDQPDHAKVEEHSTRQLEVTLSDLRLQYEELSQTLGKNHPQVQSLNRRIELVRDRLKQLGEVERIRPDQDPVDLLLQSLKTEHEENRLLLKSLEEPLAQEHLKAEELAKFLIREENAQSDVNRHRQLLDGIIDRLRQIKLARDVGGFDAHTITPPSPGIRVAPVAFNYGVLGFIGGFVVGMALAYLADFTDRSFRSPDEIQRRLGLPVVGHIPHLFSVEASNAADHRQASALLVAHHAPRSPQSEAFRGVRTSLYFSTRGTGHQLVQITSPGMGDGKSTIAANLAASIAQSGKKTVLVEADFRRPSIHKLFPSVDREVGLASVIIGDVRLEDAIQPSIVPNLWLLPCGPRPMNPAELLTSPRFQELLNEIRSQFDFVLVDTPPVLMVSDPCAVAPRVDGVLLVIRQIKNNRPAAERSIEVLASLGANILGVLVNDKSGRFRNIYRSGYGYNYDYQYGYGYQPAYAEIDDGKSTRAVMPALPASGNPTTNGHHGSVGADVPNLP